MLRCAIVTRQLARCVSVPSMSRGSHEWAASTYVQTSDPDKSSTDLRMRFTPLREEVVESSTTFIKSIGDNGFRLLNGTYLFGPIAAFPTIALSWRVVSPDDINEDSLLLFSLFDPRLDIVIVGCGDLENVDAVRNRCMPAFRKWKVPVEFMATEDAVPTFNLLNTEARYVAAALYPPHKMRITKYQKLKANALVSNNFDILPGEPEVQGGVEFFPKPFREIPDGRGGVKRVPSTANEHDIGLVGAGHLDWNKLAEKLEKDRVEKLEIAEKEKHKRLERQKDNSKETE